MKKILFDMGKRNKTKNIIRTVQNLPLRDGRDLSQVNYLQKKKNANVCYKYAFAIIGIIILCVSVALPLTLLKPSYKNYASAPERYELEELEFIESKSVDWNIKLLPAKENIAEIYKILNSSGKTIGYRFALKDDSRIEIMRSECFINYEEMKIFENKIRFKCVKAYYNADFNGEDYSYNCSFFKDDYNYKIFIRNTAESNVKKALKNIF